jgi:hypothetical protein
VTQGRRHNPSDPYDLLRTGAGDWGDVQRLVAEREGERQRLAEQRLAKRRRRALAVRCGVLPADSSPTGHANGHGGGFAATAWENVGERAGLVRRGSDTRCRCVRALPMLVWIGFDRPLEMWCHKCGRPLPRPYDRRFPGYIARRGMAGVAA